MQQYIIIFAKQNKYHLTANDVLVLVFFFLFTGNLINYICILAGANILDILLIGTGRLDETYSKLE